MSNGNETPLCPPVETPLNCPPGYDLEIARTCSFLVNVASEMCKKWIADGMPGPRDFSWTPCDTCPITCPKFPLDQWGFDNPLWWSTFNTGTTTVTEPFGVTAYSPDRRTMFVILRGSQTEADFTMDRKIRMVDYKPPEPTPITGIKVAEGFYAVFNGLGQTAITDALSQTAPLDRIIMTGHSLGSALATLYIPAALISPPARSVLHYNQASPKVGNKNFQTYYNGLGVPTFRLVNTCDKVPDLPPGEYEPVGAEACFGAHYQNEPERHNPCCSYSYALYNPTAPCNPQIDTCMAQSKPELRTP